MPSAAAIGFCLHVLFSGVFCLPLTVLRRVRGSWAGVWGRVCLAAWGADRFRGWSGRAGGWAAGLCPQVQPRLFDVARLCRSPDDAWRTLRHAWARLAGQLAEEQADDG